MLTILSILTVISLAKTQDVPEPELPPIRCPGYFSYKRNRTSGEIYGQISLPPINIDFSQKNFLLEIEMTMVTTLSVLQAEVDIKLVSKFDDLESGKKTKYNIYFPTQRFIPMLILLKADGDVVCRGRPQKFGPGEYLVTMRGSLLINGVHITNESGSNVQIHKPGVIWIPHWIIRVFDIGKKYIQSADLNIFLLPIVMHLLITLFRFVWFILLCYGN